MSTKNLKVVRPDDEEQYYKDSGDWNYEIYRSQKKRMKIAYYIAGAATIICFVAVLSIMLLIPLKTVVPYVIKVDQSTGAVEIIEPLKQAYDGEDEAITKFWIAHYLYSREQYMKQREKEDYNLVQKMSSNKVFDDYYREFNPELNEESPLVLCGSGHTLKIKIRDIVFLSDKKTALIHIKQTYSFNNKPKYYVVTLAYKYQLNPVEEKNRHLNPLGFIIEAYRKDPEIIDD